MLADHIARLAGTTDTIAAYAVVVDLLVREAQSPRNAEFAFPALAACIAFFLQSTAPVTLIRTAVATFLRFPVTIDAHPECAFLAALARLDLRALLPATRIFRLADVPLPILERLLVTLLADPDPLVRMRARLPPPHANLRAPSP